MAILRRTIIALTLIALSGLMADLFWLPLPYSGFDPLQRRIVDSINRKWDGFLNSLPAQEKKIVDMDKALNILNPVEKKFAQRILAVDPAELGFRGVFFTDETAQDLEMVPAKIFETGSKKNTGINYLSFPILQDYEKMMQAMEEDIGKRLFINDGYRSSGYQAIIFFYYLDDNGYSLLENAKWLAMPGYSEHNSLNTAIDFINQDAVSGEEPGQIAEDFEKLAEFEWLNNHAKEYNFYLTYPRDNPFGIVYEPWHWHWEIIQ